MIVMKYSLSMVSPSRRVGYIIGRMYGRHINKDSGSLWMSIRVSRIVFDRSDSDIIMIITDTDDFSWLSEAIMLVVKHSVGSMGLLPHILTTHKIYGVAYSGTKLSSNCQLDGLGGIVVTVTYHRSGLVDGNYSWPITWLWFDPILTVKWLTVSV